MSEITFTWTTPAGAQHEVPPCYSVDDWTGREMRTIDRLSGADWASLGTVAKAGLIYALSAARVVPGLTMDEADAQLTVGRIRAIMRQLDERTAAAEVPEAAAEAEHLTPTNAGSEA